MQQMIELQQSACGVLRREKLVGHGEGKFIQIDNLIAGVRVEDDVRKQICEYKGVGVWKILMGYDITVPVHKVIAVIVEFADLETILQKIAGEAVAQLRLGLQSLPGGHKNVGILVKKTVILEEHRLLGNQALTI